MKHGTNCIIWHPEKSVLLDFEMGNDCVIHAPVWIGNNVRIGNRCKVQAFAFLPDGVTLGDDVFVGPGAKFTNDRYPPSGGNWQQTIVEDGVSIGANATILSGILIGKGSRIGAGAMVTKNVKPGSKIYGNPAR